MSHIPQVFEHGYVVSLIPFVNINVRKSKNEKTNKRWNWKLDSLKGRTSLA